MNISPRPYASQGYRTGQESEEQTQDALTQDNHQGGQNRQQREQNSEPKTIARGRAPLTAHNNKKPFPKKPMTAGGGRRPIPMGRSVQGGLRPAPVTRPIQNPAAPQMTGGNVNVQQQITQRQPIPNYQAIGTNNNFNQPVSENPAQIQELDPNAQEQVNNMAKNNRVNIAQVIKDFRGTYAAIGTPQCLVDEVEDYIQQVIEHTKGDAPSINFVQTNLQNAAVIIDKYISETLDKDSKVVQNWLDALFLQRINYKYNDGEINEDFLVKFPEGGNAPQQPDNVEERAGINNLPKEPIQEEPQNDIQGIIPDYEPIPDYQPEPVQEPVNQTVPLQAPKRPENLSRPIVRNGVVTAPERVIRKPQRRITEQKPKQILPKKRKPQVTVIPEDTELKALFVQAKKQAYSNNPAKAMNIFQKALMRAESINDSDAQSKICFEMGKIYDDNNYLAQALNSYNRSLKDTTDTTIKTKAHYSMAKIYDDVNQVHSAIDHYMTSVSYAGQDDNLSSQSKSLTNIANIYTDRYNQDAFIFYDEANVLIEQTEDSEMKGYVSSNTAGAFNKFNQPDKALKFYANAVKNYSDARVENSVAENYFSAGELMYDLKNPAKAKILLKKALAHTNPYNDAELINKINDLLEEICG